MLHTHIVWFHLYEMSNIAKFIKAKSRFLASKGCGEGGMRSDCRWIWSFFRDDENIPELEK
jgi:hypothetical protein